MHPCVTVRDEYENWRMRSRDCTHAESIDGKTGEQALRLKLHKIKIDLKLNIA